MEVQVKELIEQIKADGVAAAEARSEEIKAEARAQAEAIVAEAKAKADKILYDAKNETERMTKSAEEAIRQAGRNLLISFKDSVSAQVKAILSEEVSEVYSSEALTHIIIKAVEALADNPDTETEILLNGEDFKRLEKALLSALKEKMLNGITLKPSESFNGGFRISVNGDGAFYDYSAEEVTDMLSDCLSPEITRLLKEA